MSRNRSNLRTIVVGGKHYRWTVSRTDRSVVYVKLPEGGQRILRTGAVAVDRWDDPDPVTPRMVAGLIHEHILGTSQPPRREPPARERPAPAPVVDWDTSADLPRVHVVTATLRAAGAPSVAAVVETHLEAETALKAAALLNQSSEEVRKHYRALRAWSARGRPGRMPTLYDRRHEAGTRSAPALEAWLMQALDAGAETLGEVSFASASVPFRVPVPGRPEPWFTRDSMRRKAEGTLSRMVAVGA